MNEIQLYFDDFIADISYFKDLSLIKTIHFYIKNKDLIESKLANIANLLFSIDDNNTVLYFQKKTIVGFMLISNNFDKFRELLAIFDEKKIKIEDEPPPNKWSIEVSDSFKSSDIYEIVEAFVNENIIDDESILKIYKDYFCLNYKVLSRITEGITGITCENKKNAIKGITKKQKERLTKEQQDEIIKKQEELQKEQEEEQNTRIEKEIREELIIKLSHFIYYYTQIRDGKTTSDFEDIDENDTGKHLVNIIINHYILHFFKSDRADEYNIKMILRDKKRYSNEEISLYNGIVNINEKNFEILPFLYQFEYIKNINGKKKSKHFSTCGETTLLNILNYCLIQKDGMFNTSNILNPDVIKFYEEKNMSDMTYIPNKTKIMTEWLDIVSNLGFPVYNRAGDIHNDVKNVASVLNKLVYDKDYSEYIENSSQFIVDTILYLNGDIEIELNEQKTNDTQLYLRMDSYNLFFYPGHGEMYSKIMFRIANYIKTLDLDLDFSNKNEDSDFYIIYSIYAAASEEIFGEIMDYDQAVEGIMIRYPNTFMLDIYKNIIKVFLLTVNSFRYDSNFEISDDDPNILRDESSIDNFLHNIRNIKNISIEIFDEEDDGINNVVTISQEIANSYIKYISQYCKEITTIELIISSEYTIEHINLSPLINLENIDHLNLSGIQINDIYKPLKNLKSKEKINRLSIDDYKYDKLNFDFIEEFINLEFLSLGYIDNLNPIKNLINLKTIWIRKVKIFDVKLIENLSLLEKITAYKTTVLHVESFEYLTNLKELFLVECDFNSSSIDPIVNLNKLENLMLHKSIGILGPVRIYNKNINKNVIGNLDKDNIEYVYENRESPIKSSMKKIYMIKVNDTYFKIKNTTKLGKIFDTYCNKYGLDINNISFFIHDTQLNYDDTIKYLGLDEEDNIEINIKFSMLSPRTLPSNITPPSLTRTLSSKSSTRSTKISPMISTLPGVSIRTSTSNDGFRRASPLRRVSPLRRRASPLRRRASPLRRRASPSRRRASPLRRRASPQRRASSSRRASLKSVS